MYSFAKLAPPERVEKLSPEGYADILPRGRYCPEHRMITGNGPRKRRIGSGNGVRDLKIIQTLPVLSVPDEGRPFFWKIRLLETACRQRAENRGKHDQKKPGQLCLTNHVPVEKVDDAEHHDRSCQQLYGEGNFNDPKHSEHKQRYLQHNGNDNERDAPGRAFEQFHGWNRPPPPALRTLLRHALSFITAQYDCGAFCLRSVNTS